MKIVIVGGGAGGLELATKLGRKLGRKAKAEVLLIDKNHTHLWKPLLHEVATGTLDYEMDALSYRAHGHNNGFRFRIGTLDNIDREQKTIQLSPLMDENGEQVLPARSESYDIVVLAIGSVSSDFGVEGIKQHCIFLDSADQARRFQKLLVNRFIRLDQQLQTQPEKALSIAIVGGGATGVELSAELFNARQWFSSYGLENVGREHFKVTLLEAGPRLLPALSERLAASVHQQLTQLGLEIRTATQVKKAQKGGLLIDDGSVIDADIAVWAAGVQAPEFLKDFGGLTTNAKNQIVVNAYLQPAEDPNLFVLGDCAGFPLAENKWVPPRAQAAHQMASAVYKNIQLKLNNKPLKPFVYKDHGSLVSLSRFSAVGNLMGNFRRGSSSVNLEGWLARVAYMSLYRMHQVALHGWPKTVLMTLAEKINQAIRPRLKLH